MPVLGDAGLDGTTRTSEVQLSSLHDRALKRLCETIETEMADAAAGQNYELAARLRDERDAVADEIARRTRD